MHPSIKRPFVFLFLFFFAFSLKGQVPGFYMKEEKRKVKLPFVDSNSLIIMPVSINGGEEVNFLFDTGVKSNIFFSKTLADKMQMQYTRKLNLVGADGKTVLSASVSPNNHFDLGPVEGIFQAILVLDEDFLELEKVIGVPVYGVIGHEFFKNNPVKIDYDNSTVVFYRRSALKWRPFGYRKMEIELQGNKPYIETTIRQLSGPDLAAKLLIDTGANHGLLLNMETNENIVLPEKNLESDLGRSLGGDLFGFVGRVKRVNIEGLRFRNVITSYPEENEFSEVIIETGREGSLGSDILNRMKIIMDYPRERMLYKKGAKFGDEFKYDMSGLMVRVYSAEDKRFYISQVREDSPADRQGVKMFDEIITINKIPAVFWELSEITELLRSEEGKVISLELLRTNPSDQNESTIHNITFLLEKQL
ncbi:aspartyl protease family protein [Cyclobacterium plantarum]|uniref:PDZ domain-containing protein n=1 Tax=Cyclobacterium plantarum TaxID=2716263 RepID=A0ABX0H682_9BACT|nr:aspartyl protease family protein [Cyclobacterium plantarum]NHE57072.1 PDZ domain-containing protein [Cyclobacterium plantarum]